MERRGDKLGRYVPVDPPPTALEPEPEPPREMTDEEQQWLNDALQKCREVHADPAIRNYARWTIKTLQAEKDYRPENLYMMGWVDGTRYALIQIDNLPKTALGAAVQATLRKAPPP